MAPICGPTRFWYTTSTSTCSATDCARYCVPDESYSAAVERIDWQAEQEEIRIALAEMKRLSHAALRRLFGIRFDLPDRPRELTKQTRWLGLFQRSR